MVKGWMNSVDRGDESAPPCLY